MFSSAASSPSINLEAEIALQKIKELSVARFNYNKQLLDFLLKGSEEAFKQYCEQLLGKSDWSSISNPEMMELRRKANRAIAHDAKFYEKIITSIMQEAHTQTLIDNLHYILSQDFAREKHQNSQTQKQLDLSKKKTNRSIAKQGYRGLKESDFLPEFISILDPVISQTQYDFGREIEFRFHSDYINNQHINMLATKDGGFIRLTKCIRIIQTIVSTSKDGFNFNAEDNANIADLVNKINPCAARVMEIHGGLQNDTVSFSLELYREVHNLYTQLKILKNDHKRYTEKVVEKILKEKNISIAPSSLLTPIATTAEQASATNENLAETVISEGLAEAVTNIQQAFIPENKDFEELCQATEEQEDEKVINALKLLKENVKQKIAEYKWEVELKRQAKKSLKFPKKVNNISDEIAAEDLRLNKQKIAFKLLYNLNNANIFLLQAILAKPTPHNQIRYVEIETLFGYEEGKLQGSISSVAGGSHRKVIIQGVLGFFDADEAIDSKKETAASAGPSSSTTGGLFKAHKPGHSGKLPSIAIKMLCETLERAGIDAGSFNLFLQSKKTAQKTAHNSQEKSTPAKIGLADILKVASFIERSKQQLSFLRVIYRQRDEKPSPLQHLADPKSTKARQEIINMIFKYV